MWVKGGCCVLGACRASRFLAHYSAACRISSEASSAIRYQSQVREDATIVHRQVTMAAADVALRFTCCVASGRRRYCLRWPTSAPPTASAIISTSIDGRCEVGF